MAGLTWALEVGARTLWQECRGEPREGQQAVAHVLWNRVHSGRWGPNLATVCLWRGQFSGWYVPTDPNFKAACVLPENDDTLLALGVILQFAEHDPDPTNGATHYFADTIQPPKWTVGATFCGKFGRQSFYRDVK